MVRIVVCCLLCAQALAGNAVIAHRDAPARQYTLLSFPFDWQKTIILANGNLGYDFGPGPYHAPGTEIGFSGSPATVSDQFFPDPAVPVAVTAWNAGDTGLTTESFSIVPSSFDSPSSFRSGRVRRIGHLAGTIAWANPGPKVDPSFRNVAWGTNRPVIYRVRVPARSRKMVALGICESYKGSPRSRLLELRVEGAPYQICDPVRDGRRNVPYVFFFDARDVNGDGELEIEAHTAPDGTDPNVILNAFWIFPAGTPPDTAGVISGALKGKAELAWECGTEIERLAPYRRCDAVTAAARGGRDIFLAITTSRPVSVDPATGTISLGEGMRVTCAPPPGPGTSSPAGNATRWLFPLPSGTRKASIVVTNGRADSRRRSPISPGKSRRQSRTGRNARRCPAAASPSPTRASSGCSQSISGTSTRRPTSSTEPRSSSPARPSTAACSTSISF